MSEDDRSESRQALADRIREEHRHGTGRSKLGFKVLVVVIAVVAVAAALWVQFASPDDESDEATAPRNSTEGYGFVHSASEDADPPITVTIYEDFLCDSCQLFHEEAGEYLEAQVAAGAIAVEYRPISFLVNASTDEYSQRAANAAACVADLSGVEAFINMHDLLLDHQPEHGGAGLSDDELIDFAAQAGADDAASCITDRTFDDWVSQTLDAAIAEEVTSTPTIRVNGLTILRSVNGKEVMPGLEELQYAIERAG